jgi:hypothetical protein
VLVDISNPLDLSHRVPRTLFVKDTDSLGEQITPPSGFLAAHTRSVELQLLTTGVTYRHPGACSPRSWPPSTWSPTDGRRWV